MQHKGPIQRQTVIFQNFGLGCDSFTHPSAINPSGGKYVWGENISSMGGIAQTCPGAIIKGSIQGINLQAFTAFTPLNSNTKFVAVVDGKVYVANWPSFNFVQITGIQLDPMARMVIIEEALRSVEHKSDGTIKLITPTPVLIFQDGKSRPGFWDGSSARHAEPGSPKFETPIGTWMKWTSSKLWVFNGTKGFASDDADPYSFTDTQYISERSNLEFPGEVTGVVETENDNGLLVFTRNTTTAIKSFIRGRTLWQTTQDFQNTIIPGLGCVAGKSAINQYGMTAWLSDAGWITLDVAMFGLRTNQIAAIDSEMTRSKRSLGHNISTACAAAFQNTVYISVPVGSKRNTQTWVMELAPTQKTGTPGAWQGVRTGFAPVEWSQAYVGGKERLFFASYDATPHNDTHIHIWEAARSDRRDEGGAITCQLETAQASIEGSMLRFKFCRIEVVEMLGDVELEVYIGMRRSPWLKVGETIKLQAEVGSLGSSIQPILHEDSVLQAFAPQQRTIDSEEFDPKGVTATPEMSGDVPGKDDGFQILLQWRGRMGVKSITAYFDPDSENQMGSAGRDESGQHNIINEGKESVS